MRLRDVTLQGRVLFAMFLMLILNMQQVLGYSPMQTGVAYLAVAGTAVIWADVAAAVQPRVRVLGRSRRRARGCPGLDLLVHDRDLQPLESSAGEPAFDSA